MAHEKTSLDAAITTFLDESGASQDAIVKFGPRKGGAATAQQRQDLLDRLDVARKAAQQIVWLWIGLVIGIFVLAAGFAIYYRDDHRFVAVAILGGSGIMVALLQQVKVLHARQCASQTMLALLPNTPPDQWVNVVETFAHEIVRAPK